jgi:hypothetical protein
MTIKFSDILRPLYENMKNNLELGSLENRSQLSGISGMTNLLTQFDYVNKELKKQQNV